MPDMTAKQVQKELLKRKLIDLTLDQRMLRDGITTLPNLAEMARINALVHCIWDPKDS